MIFGLNLYSQTNLDYEFKNPFRVYETDKYYMGWQDPRAFIGRLLFAKNFNVEKNLTKISPEANWDFKSVSLYVEGKVASEIMFYRNKYFSVGMGAGMEISILGRKNGLFDVYDFSGQFDLFLDLWLQNLTGINLKIRFIPMYHQSTHLADGFKGDVHIRSGSSYEFAAISVYYYINNFTIYGGWEFSYNTVGNSPQIFRLHTGFDYRLPLYKEINFITGINLAVILDKKDNLGLIRIRENLHAAINLAAGIEFYRFAIALKFGYGKPRGASSYFGYESKIGAEISLLF
ncbi:hypothetical protein EPJ64_01425 [Brachyspira aalborgi]|uniref:hypothetical protein n=1 Tax=Brachyspira aalborgi TaxID=29522 RepID=UPI0011C6F7DC|nr:hypothetical protein [Brachyspira aalborgi]TXJ16923.1 hypothetical protein EPJ77_00650 [Brachyspira aalborgi]TXJ22317.1 hypothetical protein EPJ64_01425 [Brachyspira aalborgi]